MKKQNFLKTPSYYIHIYIEIKLKITVHKFLQKHLTYNKKKTQGIQTKINTFKLKITSSYDSYCCPSKFQFYYGQQMADRLGIAFGLQMFDYYFKQSGTIC